jgi:NADH-quinone oxidoreductase subunit G
VASPLAQQADIFLPTQTVYEAGGRWINQEGRLQSAQPVLVGGASIAAVGQGDHPPRIFGDTLPEGSPAAAWTLLPALTPQSDDTNDGGAIPVDEVPPAAMERIGLWTGALQDGNRIALPEGEAHSASRGQGEVLDTWPAANPEVVTVLLADWTFGTEKLSTGCTALMERTPPPEAVIHPETGQALGLAPGGRAKITTPNGSLTLALRFDARMAPNVMVIPRHVLLEWQVLGATRLTLAAGQISAA